MGPRQGRSSGPAAQRRRWTYRREASPWFSPAIAAAATAVVFGTAFVSMTSLRNARARPLVPEAPVPINLAVRPAIRTPPPSPRPTSRHVAPPEETPVNPQPPAAVDSGSLRNSARDTAAAPRSRAAEPNAASIPRGVAMPSGIGSRTGPEYTPAWVAAGTKLLGPAGSAQLRDSISDALKPAAEARAWARPMSAGTRAEIAETQRQASILDRRTMTAGNSRDLHAMSGQGVGGVGGVGVGGSIGVPLFSRGPSAAQRARDAKVEAENRAIMQRLAERARAKRDSIRRDSIRADSARNATTARRPARGH